MSNSAFKRNQTTLQLANFVDWGNLSSVEKMRKKVHKTLKKGLKTKSVKSNRINTFEVISADLKIVPDLEKRKSIEQSMQEIFADYASKINMLHRKQVNYNGDSQHYKSVTKSLDLEHLNSDLVSIQHERIDAVLEKIAALITESFVTTWSLASNEPDRIIIGGLSAEVHTSDDQDLDQMIDELLIFNLGRNFLPFTEQLVNELYNGFLQLLDLTTNGQATELLTIFPQFLGSVSGLQESLKLMERQVVKVCDMISQTAIELGELSSVELNKWIDDLDEDCSKRLTERLANLNTLIINLKKQMRAAEASVEKIGAEAVLKQMISLRASIAATRLWVNRFQDIPSFATMEDGIAFEEVEGEKYVASDDEALLEATTLFKNFRRGDSSIYALRGVDLKVYDGEFLIIKGPSGAGKTTLLSILAGLEKTNRGTVFFKGDEMLNLKDGKKSKIRRENFSFIFQSYALIPHLTAFENVKLPLELTGLSKELQKGIQDLLNDVGIGPYSDHKPAYLSGGQMQRLGIARALVGKPKIIFADEATGDLDRKTTRVIMDLLKKYNEETGVTIVFVTHDDEVASYGTRQIYLEDGQIIS